MSLSFSPGDIVMRTGETTRTVRNRGFFEVAGTYNINAAASASAASFPEQIVLNLKGHTGSYLGMFFVKINDLTELEARVLSVDKSRNKN